MTTTEQKVADFLAQRVEYVRTLRQCVGADADYHRWQGHAEARRQLANALGVKVPFEWSDVDEMRAALAGEQPAGQTDQQPETD